MKQVSNTADLTSLDTKVIVTFDSFCMLHRSLSSRNCYYSFKVKKKSPMLPISSRTSTDFFTSKGSCALKHTFTPIRLSCM